MKNNRIKEIFEEANANPKIFEIIFGLLVLVVGVSVRINFVSGSSYPMNDGGFFFTMTEELIENGFRLPKFTSYNFSDIPFAYPPLAFYIVGIINKLSGISLLSLFRYFPLVISCLTIPAYYLLTGHFFKDKIYRLLTVYLFVTLPRSFEWFVMGGGITRSVGFLFAILAIYFIWNSLEEDKFGPNLTWGAVFSGLTILSHPVTSLFLVFSVIVIYLYNYPFIIKNGILLVFMIIGITSPWWITILGFHGISPYIGASNTGHLNWFEIKNLITLNFGYENQYFLSVVSLLAILGMFSKRKKMSLLLTIIWILGYFAIPRGGIDLLTAFLPALAVLGFEVVTNPWNKEERTEGGGNFPLQIGSKRTRTLLFFFILYLFLGAYTYKYVNNKFELRLDRNNVMAMEWLKENTKETDSVLLVPTFNENRYWWNDYISEWFPALSARKNVTTVQGYEWIPAKFDERILMYTSLRSCGLDYHCIQEWQLEFHIEVDYIYLDNLNNQGSLAENLLDTNVYSIDYENENVMIISEIEP